MLHCRVPGSIGVPRPNRREGACVPTGGTGPGFREETAGVDGGVGAAGAGTGGGVELPVSTSRCTAAGRCSPTSGASGGWPCEG